MQSSALFTGIEKDVSTSKEIRPHLLHLKYSLPAQCLCMYVCRRCQYSKAWKLPYLLADGGVDGKQLPKQSNLLLAIIGEPEFQQYQNSTYRLLSSIWHELLSVYKKCLIRAEKIASAYQMLACVLPQKMHLIGQKLH
jgi:hypothetical protein